MASSFPRTWKSTAGNWFSIKRRASSWLPSDWTICSELSNKTTSVRSPGREWGNSPAARSPALNRALPFAASVMVLARGPLVPSSSGYGLPEPARRGLAVRSRVSAGSSILRQRRPRPTESAGVRRTAASTHVVAAIRYQLCIGLISFPLQFRRRGRNPAVAPRPCAMLESAAARIPGRPPAGEGCAPPAVQDGSNRSAEELRARRYGGISDP